MTRELPQAPDEPGAEAEGTGNGAPPPEPPAVSSGRLVATLTIAGALAGLVIVLAFAWANPRIQAHRAEALRAAIQDVLSAPAAVRTYYVTGSGLSKTPPPGADTITAEKVHLGLDAAGEPIGYAITGQEAGFQDVILVIFGYDPAAGEVLAMRVLESKETPGLGDKIIKDSAFVAEFRGVRAPLQGVKAGRSEGDPGEVDMITGATISSRTVIGIINHRIEALAPLLEDAPAGAETTVDAVSDRARGAGEEGGSIQ
ncbi:MAG: FMN-binding protein [Gemmatimonadota bacterium]|nr:FMN-binding protein [Gemmatimonadota bacterium]